MTDDLLHRIDDTLRRATDSGALQPIRTEQTHVRDAGFDFTVRWVSTLALKDAARVNEAVRRDPTFNPFLPPDPQLTVGPLGERHLAVLNKFPVIERHLLIVTRAFEEQCAPLTLADFDALAIVMRKHGGLGFYNGGPDAGASQRHKHLQWIPGSGEGTKLDPFTRALPTGTGPIVHPALPWRQCFVRIRPHFGGAAMLSAFEAGCRALGIDSAADPMPPYNFLATLDWMVVIPRSCERHHEISVNALGFAGSLFVRHPEQIDTVRDIGPLSLLTAVAQA
ncbi:DUF4922 domain-containing protein [Azoarcus sp. KH32C]|uniref:ATP adenylyltransferase family protein n=1 Tax=Azoarcus sp. KH32C TaxID=748247 RepID=UPI000238674C|nr:DUF4922 domain-containing protein [Azoarcus sp. KH32C]BAL25272.1 Ap4A phosphorylase II [Azoarcus sp. KH32C]